MGASEGLPYMANDAATKAYIVSLGAGLNVELQKHGIHVSVLLPGPTQTPVLDRFGLDVAAMPVKPMTVSQCVAEGLTALQQNKASHLSGRLNRIMSTVVPVRVRRRLLGNMLAQGVRQQQEGQPVVEPNI
jgi:short-subunit dehydrogenase